MSSKDFGEEIWSKLTISKAANKHTIEKYKKATIAWLNDTDPFSTIDKFGISQNTYRKYMARNVDISQFPDSKAGSDWKIKLFSIVGLKICYKCGIPKKLKEDYSPGQSACKTCQQHYRENNRERQNAYTKEHYIKNSEIYKDRAAARRARVIEATPSWANREKILQMYKTCPEGYEVDHIVPLNGETVCGLHVEYNLQHLPASENRAKSNKLIEEFIYGQ